MVNVYDNQTGGMLGTLTHEQLAFLTSQLEEESASDQDYYINGVTIDLFAAEGADPALIAFLRAALGTREDMEIRWDAA